ncbi:cytochrome P450 [Amycolatopsis saalfeldensis]|uniref:Cytochrome P450 n=1 Tax=Amycolatopsis saalfeldensis TaxID=394193 RepID=A0A1H8YQB2_9PSEU|nr:cytochrome P450 [Amycolatopsis saalfeldensis]SEP53558.1 Cytochrome P450 [Amycolatopsis saalfeldensis]
MGEPLASLPTRRDNPFDPPPELLRIRDEPVHRLSFPDGHAGWLVTGYSTARKVLADRRFSVRQELRHELISRGSSPRPEEPAQPGFFARMDPPEHTRYRRLMTAHFTVRRMKHLTTRVEQITRERLDAMRRLGPPVDLVKEFALPIPSTVICELLGVPYADHEFFQGHSSTMVALDISREAFAGAMSALRGYLAELAAAKRAGPTDDMISVLAREEGLTDLEIVNIALLLLVAGHETTANMLTLGTYALLRNPEQLALLRSDPSLVEAAVEELLRYLSVVHLGVRRVALEDVELDGMTVGAGETVVVSLPVADRDPERHPNPDELDLARPVGGHLAFGHGVHQCLGQQLARTELRVGYTELLRKFPSLRMAVSPSAVAMRENTATSGVQSLPVAW